MKRWIVYGLLALAVIVLVSPGIVGRLAERNLRTNVERVEAADEGLLVTRETFRRGWFTALGRHRIELRRSGGVQPVGDEDSRQAPALIVDTRIDHGLVPLGTLARDALSNDSPRTDSPPGDSPSEDSPSADLQSLRPALASMVSTLSLDLGNGRVVELPGALYSRLGLTGGTVSRYTLEDGTFRDGELELEWRGADVRFELGPGNSSIDYRGRVEPVGWAAAGSVAGSGAMQFDGALRQTDYGFHTGTLGLQMADVSFAGTAGEELGFGRLSLAAESALAGTRVDGTSTLEVEQLLVPGAGPVDVDFEVAIEGLDAASVQRIREAIGIAREAAGPLTLGAVYPLIERDLEALLGAGAALHVRRFDLSLPAGVVTAVGHLDLPETATGGNFSWPTLLLSLQASVDVRVPAALVEAARSTYPQADSLIAAGMLKRDGDAYVIEAVYARGLVTVNGAPIPLAGIFEGLNRGRGPAD